MDDRPPLSITPRQYEVMEVVRDSRTNGIEELFLIGPIGTSKTFAMAYAHICIAESFPGSIIPVGRKDLSEAQIGTWQVYLEVLEKMGMADGADYSLRQAPNDLRIKLHNGSIIQFIGMNKSRDREWAKLKITATCAGVDEVDDVDEGGYIMLQSRTGRRNDNGAPRITISACNPNEAWTKQKVYLPWLKSIGRRPENMSDEEWNVIEPLPPSKKVIEFTMQDSMLYSTGYYDRFMERPKAWVQRYLFNNWNYYDDSGSLFKSRNLDRLTVSKIKRGTKYIGVDPQAGGNDRAVIAVMEDNCFIDFKVYTTEDLERLATPDELEPSVDYGRIIGRLTIETAIEEGVGYEHIAGDVVGIGQAWLSHMLSEGYDVIQYRSGDSPIKTIEEDTLKIKPPYDMLRSQIFHKLAQATEKAEVFFYTDCPFLSEFKKELLIHQFDETAKVMKVEKKTDLKKRLGKSPDIADAGVMAYHAYFTKSEISFMSSDLPSLGQNIDDGYTN